MSTDFDIKKYLIEEMGFPEAEATTMAGNFKPENVAKVQASRSTMEAERAKVTKAQTDLEAANERLNAEMAEWAQLTSAEKANATAQAARIEELEGKAFQLQQKLTRVATDAGIDPKTVLPTEPVVEPKKEKTVPDFDASKYVEKNALSPALDYALELPATLQFIADQHRDLFGQNLDTREIMKEIRSTAGKPGAVADPVAVWESKFKVPERRSALAEESRQKELKAAEDRGYARRAEEIASPGPATPGNRSPVFISRDPQHPRVSALRRPTPESSLRSATSALLSGKYRPAK